MPRSTMLGPLVADAPQRSAPEKAVREVLLVYLGVFAGTAALGALRMVPGADDISSIGIALLFLGVPIAIARREPEGSKRYGIALGGLLEPASPDDPEPAGPLGIYDLGRSIRRAAPSGLRELGFALLVAAIVFPPFVLGFWGWNVWLMGAPSHPFRWSLPADLLTFALTQIVVVGLPEEAFFRGYVQTRLHDRFAPRRLLGADLHLGVLVAQAALFALVHLATEPRVEKLATFFPGLLFGWMRARRGGIEAAMTMHAMSNVLAEVLVNGWLR